MGGVQQINEGSLAVDYTHSHKRKYVVFCAGGAQYIMYEVRGKRRMITGLWEFR